MEGKKLVYTSQHEHMASMVKGRLESEGIKVLVFDREDSAYTVLGEIQLFVEPQDEERAKAIIASEINE